MTGKSDTLPTVREIPDDLWEQIHPVILQVDPPKSTGRKRARPRGILDGIIFRMRAGCHWNRLPRDRETTAPSTAPSGAGWNWGCWSASGPCWPGNEGNWDP